MSSQQNDGNLVQNYENKNADKTMINVPHLKEAPIPSFMKDAPPQAPPTTPSAVPPVTPPTPQPDYAPVHPDTTGELTGTTAQLDLNDPTVQTQQVAPPPTALPQQQNGNFDPSAPNTNTPWGMHGTMPNPSAPNTSTPWGANGGIPTPVFLQQGDLLNSGSSSQAAPQPASSQPTQQQLLNQVPLNQAIQNGAGVATPPPLLPAQGYKPFVYSGQSDATLQDELRDFTNWSSQVNNSHQNLGQININHNTVTDPTKARPDTTKAAGDSWWGNVVHFFGGIGASSSFDPTKGQFGQAGTGAVGGILYGAMLPWNMAVGTASWLRNQRKDPPGLNQFSQYTGPHDNPVSSFLNHNFLPDIANGANGLIKNVLNPALTAAQQPIFGGPANKHPVTILPFDTHPVEPIAKTTGNPILNALRGQQYSFAGKQDSNNPIGFGGNGNLTDPRTWAGFASDIVLSHHVPNPIGHIIGGLIGKAAGGVVRRVLPKVAESAEEVAHEAEAVHPTTGEVEVKTPTSIHTEPGGDVVSPNFERKPWAPETPESIQQMQARMAKPFISGNATVETPAYKGFQSLTEAEHAAPQATHGASSIEKLVNSELNPPKGGALVKYNPVLRADPGASLASMAEQETKFQLPMPDGTTKAEPINPVETSKPASIAINAVDPTVKVPDPLIEHNIASGNVVPISGSNEVAETAALAQSHQANITRLQAEIERLNGVYDTGNYANLTSEIDRLENLSQKGGELPAGQLATPTASTSTVADNFANLSKAEQQLEATRNILTSSKTPEYRVHMADKLSTEAENLAQLSQHHEEISAINNPDTHVPVDRGGSVSSLPQSDATTAELKQWLRDNYKAKSTAPLPTTRAELAQYLHNESQYVGQSAEVHRQIALQENGGLPPTPVAPPTNAVTSLKDLLLYQKAKLSALPDIKAPAVPAPKVDPDVLRGTTNLSEIASTVGALNPGTQVTENLSRQPRTVEQLDALARITPAPDGKPIIAPDALPSTTHSQIAAAQQVRGATDDVYQRILGKSGAEVPTNTLQNASHVTVETSPAVPLGEPSRAAIVRIKGNADETLMQLAKKAETVGLTPAEQHEMDSLKQQFTKPSREARVASQAERNAMEAQMESKKDTISQALDLAEKRANGTLTDAEAEQLANLSVGMHTTDSGKRSLLETLQNAESLDDVQQRMVAKLQNQLGFDTIKTPTELHNALGELEHPSVSDPEVLDHVQRTQLPESQVGSSPEVVKATDLKLSAETNVKNVSTTVNHLYNELDLVDKHLESTYNRVQQTSDIGRRELPRDMPSIQPQTDETLVKPVKAAEAVPSNTAKGRMGWRDLQRKLINYREQGYNLTVPTNSSRDVLERELARIEASKLPVDINEQVNSKTFFHGTKVQDWSPTSDWYSGGSRAEWGHGTYYSADPSEAKMYADRAVNRNVPGDFGRTYGDEGFVHEVKPNVHDALDVNSVPENPDAMKAAFKRNLSDAGVSERAMKSFDDMVDGMPLKNYYSSAEKLLNKVGITDEEALHNYSRNLSTSIRGMGYDAITDGHTLNMLDSSDARLLQSAATPANDALDQARQAFNADSTVAARNPDIPSAQINHIESAVTLQSRMLDHVKDSLESTQEVQKRAIDALWESDKHLENVASQEQAIKKVNDFREMHEQLGHDIELGNKAIDNPCEF